MYKQRISKACDEACMKVCLAVARTGAELLQRPPADVVVVGSERLTARPLGLVAVDGSVGIVLFNRSYIVKRKKVFKSSFIGSSQTTGARGCRVRMARGPRQRSALQPGAA